MSKQGNILYTSVYATRGLETRGCSFGKKALVRCLPSVKGG